MPRGRNSIAVSWCCVIALGVLLHTAAAASADSKPTFEPTPPTPAHATDRVIVKLASARGAATAASTASRVQVQGLQAGESVEAALKRLNARHGESRQPGGCRHGV